MLKLAMVLIAVASCNSGADKKEVDAAELPTRQVDTPDMSDTIEVGYSALRISLPLFVAAERGHFTRHGLDVKLKRYETAQPLVEEVLDGRIPMGGYAALPIVLTVARGETANVHAMTILVEDQAHPVSVLLRRKDAPTIRSIQDLRGKRVGLLPTIAYQKWFERMLQNASMDPSEVQVTPLAPALQVQALAEGGVDALFTNDPMATAAIVHANAERFGPQAPVVDAVGGPLYFGTFLTASQFARERPQLISRMAAALDDAIEDIRRNRETTKMAMKPYLRPTDAPLVERYPDARYLQTDEFSQADLDEQITAMHTQGIIATRQSLRTVRARAGVDPPSPTSAEGALR